MPMEPLTITGLVIGVIPLLIAAVENYEVTFQPFVSYRRYEKEVRRFASKLDAQRAIFLNECQLLLLAIGQNFAEILRDPNHAARNDEQLSRKLEELLGSSYNSCISTLNLINDSLNEVSKETQGFDALLDIKNSKGKGRCTLFRQKIKISFAKNRLTDSVNNLRLYNEDLGRLSSQIRNLASNSVQPSQSITSTVTKHLKTTQEASGRLYDVLASRWFCDDHVEHVASMSLKVEEKCKHSASKVRFNLVVNCIQPHVKRETLWLAIESVPGEGTQDSPLDEQSAALQTTLRKMGATAKVRFAISSPVIAVSPRVSQTSISESHPNPPIDLHTIGSLCQYFRELHDQLGPPEPCVGYLEKTNTFKHFLYRSPAPRLPEDASRSVSLKQILRSAATEESREGDWIEKLRLARLLALAVLRFHDTKWLPRSWGSDDVQFIGTDAAPDEAKLPQSPCLAAKLSSNSPATRQIVNPNTSASGLATNETLFNLGVVLIELGYNAPFENLCQNHQSSDLPIGATGQVADFMAARRLGGLVHKKLNMTYGRLVEKCLNCNFGVATKLDDVELQGAVVVQVVNQLDVCLEQYLAFNSLAPLQMGI